MTIQLTKEEKAQIIISHVRNLAFSKYNLEIDIIQENAKAEPYAGTITSINAQIDEIQDQISALNAELAIVNALAE